MRLKRFVGEKIHNFLDFDFVFNNDLTFLTGINGCGKTTVLNTIIALITPSLTNLAELKYGLIRIEFENDGNLCFIQARKKKNEKLVEISTSISDKRFEYAPYFLSLDAPLAREADYQQEYYRELLANNSQHPAIQFIVALPTPMFLGLDRRAVFSVDEGTRPASSRFGQRQTAGRPGRNIFSLSLASSVRDFRSCKEIKISFYCLFDYKETCSGNTNCGVLAQ